MACELQRGDYVLSDDQTRLDVDLIHRYLSEESYWAKNIPRSVVETAVRNSLCLGCYHRNGTQVGLARAITDYATYAWLCDVFVVPSHRQHGLGKALVEGLLAHPRLQGLRRVALATQDAHGLYALFGFTPLADATRHMEKCNLNVYAPKSAD